MNKLFKDEPAVLVDAYAWIFRAYYALPDFRNSAGQPTAAVHGFLTTLPKFVSFLEAKCGSSPEFVIVFDRGGPQERLAAYPEYKAHRPETPPELKSQVPLIEEALSALGLPQVALEGVEADDVIGSMALRLAEAGRRVVVASNDKDFYQILGDNIQMLRPSGRADDFVLFDEKALKTKYGLGPETMAEFYALVGDTVDNVPGVRGIGEKTASKLLKMYPTLEDLYENVGRLPKTTAKILDQYRDDAFLSRSLVRLRTDLDVDVEPEGLTEERFDRARLRALLEKLELKRLVGKFLGESARDD